MLDSLAPARRRFVLLLLGLLALAALLAAVLAGARALDRADPVAQADVGPVVVLTGYGGNTAAVAPLAQALRDAGRTVEVLEPVGDGTGDLREQAEALDATVDGVLAATSAPSVDVVGYSAGGVVARLWVAELGGAELARRVLTIGSPHHGTDVVALLLQAGGPCPEGCRQLSPDSPLLQRLNIDETPPGPAFVSVWTEADRVVTPPSSARLDGAVNLPVQAVCAGSSTTHGGLPGDPVVLALLDSALGTGPPRPPDDVTCAA